MTTARLDGQSHHLKTAQAFPPAGINLFDSGLRFPSDVLFSTVHFI